MPSRPPTFYPPGLAPADTRQAYERERGTAAQRGYDGAWRRESAAFLRAHPTCRCGSAATVVDHVVPHRGDRSLFWDRRNWQGLCASCHGAKTRAEGPRPHKMQGVRAR